MKFILPILIFIWLTPAIAVTQALPDAPNPAHAQDWDRVADLARGDEISVTPGGDRSLRCLFAGATNQDLFCTSQFSDRELRFKRTEIEKVRFNDERRNRSILIGTLVLAGIGASFAVPRQPGDTTPTAVRATIFGSVGLFTGLIFSPLAHFIPGKLIYRRTAHGGPTAADPVLQNQTHQERP
jgi:hypothetical protein